MGPLRGGVPMPRKSPYVLDLTPDQRRELEVKARRYTLPYRDVVRAKIVLMAAEGLDNDEIAARLDTRREIVAEISGTTIWRWLSEDAIRPWKQRSWIFPRDPQFETKAGRALDLYARVWQGKPPGERDYVLSADQKTSIQARVRCHPSLGPAAGRDRRVEHEYDRGGALAYLVAWDVHRAKVMGRCEPTTGIAPFGRLVDQVMTAEPYASARRVFWVVDNGSSHRGQASIDRLEGAWENLTLV